MSEFDDTLTCPVCYECFDSGDIVPRLLPCSHTACERCLTGLLQADETLVCPECRKRHAAEGGVKGFPQNRYIMKLRHRISSGSYDFCPEHNRDLSLYCKSEGCRKEICQLCLLEGHMNHAVVDLMEEAKVKVDAVRKCASENEKLLGVWKKETNSEYDASLAKLKEMKSNFVDWMDALIERVADCQLKKAGLFDNQLEQITQRAKILNIMEDGKIVPGKKVNSQIKLLESAEEEIRAVVDKMSLCARLLPEQD